MAILGAIGSLILAILAVTVIYGLLGTAIVFLIRVITISTSPLLPQLKTAWLIAFLFTLALYLISWQGVMEIMLDSLK